jgi:hypothetical protein
MITAGLLAPNSGVDMNRLGSMMQGVRVFGMGLGILSGTARFSFPLLAASCGRACVSPVRSSCAAARTRRKRAPSNTRYLVFSANLWTLLPSSRKIGSCEPSFAC